jgi:hypothetical protein
VRASGPILSKAAEVTSQEHTAKQLADNYKMISKSLFDTSVSIVNIPPDPKHWYEYEKRELLGIVAMAAFLSLGSPFWYNVLKGLTSLRPMIAKTTQG